MSKRIYLMFALLCSALASVAASAATFSHQQLPYYVPEKRIRVDAGISDPKGVQVARVYFKAGPQADYIFVPMQQTGGRYIATLPAPSASAGSMEYLLLALNNDGQVSRTEAYKVAARRSNETPSWQSAGGQGDVKVFTEIPDMPKPIAAYSDSIAMDVVESGARLGGAVGLYAGTGGGAGAGAATAKSAAASTTSTTTATAGTIGGFSTAAIVGGVVVAGAAVAAASGGGGGGGSSSPPGGTTTSFAGTYSGTESGNVSFTCPSQPTASGTCTFSSPFTVTVDSNNVMSGSSGNGTVNCSNPSLGSFAQVASTGGPIAPQQISSGGTITIPGSNFSQSGVTVNCQSATLTFTTSPHRVTGSQQCSGSFVGPPQCTFSTTTTISGS